MSTQEQEIIDFVDKIPLSTNPYLVMVPVVENLIKPPREPDWSIILQRAMIAAFCIMFLQSCFLIYQRIRLKVFGRMRYNKLGLLQLDISDCSGIFYFLYTTLTIVDLSLRQSIRNGANNYATEIIVFGYKFLPILAGGWVFLWLCASQAASVLFDKLELVYLNETRLIVIKKVLCWSLTIFIVATMIVQYPLVMWAYASARQEYIKMTRIIDSIAASLVSESSNYDQGTYNKLSLLSLLIPARTLTTHQSDMERYVDFGIKTYLVAVLFAVIVYIPLISISLWSIFNNSTPSSKNINKSLIKSENDHSEVIMKIGKTHVTRRRLVFHAILLYASVATHVPALIWQVLNNKPGYLKSSKWNTVTILGLHLPFAITGNLVVLVLNLNSSSIPIGIMSNLKDVERLTAESCSKQENPE